MSARQGDAAPRVRERAVNVPPGVLMVMASILGGYLLQRLAPAPMAMAQTLGLDPRGFAQGRWWTLVTVLVVHGSWAHAGLNALGALAFGPAVARRLGAGAGGLVRFLAFYLVCGAAASLGYVAVHWSREVMLVGASGAISGLMGASSRLLDRGPGLAPFTSRTVVGMALAWGAVNVLMAFGWIDVGAGAPIAWEAHLFGYAAGLLLLAPFDRLCRKAPPTLQPPEL